MNPMIDLLLSMARILVPLHPDLAPKIGAVEDMIAAFDKVAGAPDEQPPAPADPAPAVVAAEPVVDAEPAGVEAAEPAPGQADESDQPDTAAQAIAQS